MSRHGISISARLPNLGRVDLASVQSLLEDGGEQVFGYAVLEASLFGLYGVSALSQPANGLSMGVTLGIPW